MYVDVPMLCYQLRSNLMSNGYWYTFQHLMILILLSPHRSCHLHIERHVANYHFRKHATVEAIKH